MADTVEVRFKKAVWLIRNGPKEGGSSNDTKLQFYSFFKQATVGDVQGDRPGMLSFEARAKYDAWAKIKGMSAEEAMQGYIDLMGDPEVWENHAALAAYDPATFSLA